jgi:hypothetical protein
MMSSWWFMRQCARGAQRRGQGSGWDVYSLLCVVHRSLAPAAGRRSGTAGTMSTVLVAALSGLVTARVANGLSFLLRDWR